jgi:plastocyanin/heme-degrading monooxygenase HmoA
MEYVQTVLARVAAARFEDALAPGGLFPELEAHRAFVAGQPGARGMSVTRSANPEGDVLVVVETRWANNNALADYSAGSRNAASILNSHSDLLTADGVQVHRMQTDQATVAASTRVYDRLALALLVPLGVLAFALLVIYGLSRIYLSLPSDWATPLAAVIALGVLGVSWFFATHPAVPRAQMAGFFVLVLAVFAGAATTAAVWDANHDEVKHAESPTPPPSGTPTGNPVIDMADFEFVDASGAKNPTLTAPANTEFTFDLRNTGQAVHNMHISSASGEYAASICTATGADPCSKPVSINGGASGTITFNLAAGTYNYRCDFHPTQMLGKIEIK